MKPYFKFAQLLLLLSIFCSPVFGQTTLINNSSSWSYYDNQNEPSDQGVNDWNDLAYDDSSWSSGDAHLGYGDGDETTIVNSSTYTLYLRREFNVADPSAFSSLDIDLTYDDGAVVYLNGTEVWRVNMPSGTISYNTFTPSSSSDNALASNNIANNLVAGNNVLAVEVHQRSSSSSDLSFDLELTAVDVAPPSGNDIIVENSSWKYLDNGSDQGTAWRGTGFDDSSWASGNAELGYGDGNEATTLGFGPDANNKYITAYFRKTVNVSDASAFDYLELEAIRDDGIVVYINGTEVWRDNMPTGIINYNTLASSPEISGAAESTWITQSIANSLVNGNNVIAVEIHQQRVNSSDISFNFKMTGASAPPVSNDIVDANEEWKYLDDGSNQGVAWTTIGYNDGAWASGNAELGYGDTQTTTVGFGPDSNNKYPTTYFRKSFTVTDPSQYDYLEMEAIRDDGMAVYLNGTLVWTNNMPGSWDYQTYASATVGGADETTWISQIVANSLVIGTNVLAVEIHQTNASSSDISFNFQLSGSTTTPGAVNVERGPYLQKGTSTSMVIKWRTEIPTESVVNYGTALGSLSSTASDLLPKTEHEIEITGLTPNTVYYYEIANSSAILVSEANDMYFKSHPTIGSSQPFTFWALGDPGTANSNQRNVRDAYYNYIGSNVTDGILFLGDNAYNSGTDSEYQNAVFENMYEDKLKNSVAWSCLGNHDGYSADSNAQTGPYYDIFTFPTAGESGGVASGTEAYYSFDYGNVHFIVLDSYDTSRSVGGTMYNWAQSDIQNTTQDWIIAMWHHPPYTKGSHDSDSETELIQMRENFLPMLEANGVDLVLNGHSHSYERSYFLNGHYGNSGTFNSNNHTVGATGDGDGRIDGNGAYIKDTSDTEGAVYITAGSSGKTSGGSLNHNAMNISLNQLGSCILEVDGNELNLKFIRDNGAIADYFTIQKPNSNPTWYQDLDADSYGNPAVSQVSATQPAGYVADNTDCDDTQATINPGTVWYADADGDGYGDNTTTLTQCTQPAGYILDNTDCDDVQSSINPDTVWYADADGDGYGDINNSLTQCDLPAGYVLNNTDCNDSEPLAYPGNNEVLYDGVDNDCNPATPDTIDADGDGVNSDTDCDDNEPLAYPGNTEVLYDGIDNDCNPATPDTIDADGDGVNSDTDCDDNEPLAYPGNTEVLYDGIDNDCNPATPDTIDADGDGVNSDTDCDDNEPLAYPGNTEVLYDGIDNDCNPATPDTIDADGDGVNSDTDCDDNEPLAYPGNTEILYDGIDNDCNPATPDVPIDADGDGVTSDLDCDDNEPLAYPGNTEVLYDGIDNDCNPATPDTIDADGDGVNSDTDCDDNNPLIYPGNTEILYDGIDNDCNPATLDTEDADGDGVNSDTDCDDNEPLAYPGNTEVLYDGIDNDCNPATPDTIDADGDGVNSDTDCDDNEPLAFPGNIEVLYDGIDNDCNPATPDTQDADGDGVNSDTDCDDNEPLAYPGNTEVLYDGIDNDCNPATSDTIDADGDGVNSDIDCDDNEPLAYPGNTEILCDGIDNDCNPATPDTVVADAGTDVTITEGDSTTLTASGGASYLWSTGATTASIIVSPNSTTTYSVTVSQNGCSDVDDVIVTVEPAGCTYSVINSEGFESGWGIWNDGGSDARRSSRDAAYATTGTYCLRIRDNTSTSVVTTDDLDLSIYEELTVDFAYYARSMDNSNEDFWLQVSTNGGSSYTTVEEWNRNDEFINNTFNSDQVIIPGPFTSNTRLRFRCDASGNSDWIYIDDVIISGCSTGGAAKIISKKQPENVLGLDDELSADEITSILYPNPFDDKLNIKIEANYNKADVRIFNVIGQSVFFKSYLNKETIEISTKDFQAGPYIIRIDIDGETMHKRVIKK